MSNLDESNVDEIKATIKKLEQDMVESLMKGDAARLDQIFADEFIITDPNGPSFTNCPFAHFKIRVNN